MPGLPVRRSKTFRRALRGARTFRKKAWDFAFILDSPSPFASPAQKISNSQIQKFGKPFLGAFPALVIPSPHRLEYFHVGVGPTSYESPVGIVVEMTGAFFPLATAQLGFGRKTVLIESIHGAPGVVKDLQRFSKAVGMPWPNFLLRKIMATARRLGYQQVIFRDPTSLHYYARPYTGEWRNRYQKDGKQMTDEQASDAIRSQMERFYKKIRDALDFSQREGDYWVKKL